MTFRARFFVLFSLATLAGIGLLAWGATRVARQQFEHVDAERRATLTEQFQRELAQRGQEVSFAMQGLADAEGTVRMALDLSRTQADASIYANDARGLAAAHQLDFLDLAAADGTLISSAQGRSGYKDDWVTSEQDWNQRGAFLQRIDLPDGAELGLLAVRVVSAGATKLYLIGGRRLDHEFLHTLALPAGTRALLYRNLDAAFAPDDLAAAEGGVDQPERFAGIIESAEKSQAASQQAIAWTADPAGTETFSALPLTGRQNEAFGVVLIGSTQRDLLSLLDSIRLAALIAALLAILAGIFMSRWLSARVTKPLERITASVREVTAGNWSARVDIRGSDEAGQLAEAFNEMTRQLPEERTRLLQAERVAAWRDVTQRMTQEVKQSLFPLEVTVGSLSRVPDESSSCLGSVVQESVAALRLELGHLKAIAMRFSELSKMPQPRLKPVDLNELLREVLKSFEPQFRPFGRPPITPELSLDGGVSKISGDADLLRKALESLLLHAIDAMPAGGALTVSTEQSGRMVRVEVSSSGAAAGATPGESLFAAFRTKQSEGAGLGLPTTQAIVSDHGGKFFAEAVPGVGTAYRLEFAVASGVPVPAPVRADARKRKAKRDLPEISQIAVSTRTATVESVPAVAVDPAAAAVVARAHELTPEFKRGLPEIPPVATVLGASAVEPESRVEGAPAIAVLDPSAPEPKRDLQEVLQAAALNMPAAQTGTRGDTAATIADAPVTESKQDLQELLQAAGELAGPATEPAMTADVAPNVTLTDAPVAETKRDLHEALQVAAPLSVPAAEAGDRADAGPTIAVPNVSKAEPKDDLQEIFQAVAVLTASTARPIPRVDVVPAIVTVDASALESKGDLQDFLQAAAAALAAPAIESTPGTADAPSVPALAEPKFGPQEIPQEAAALEMPAAEALPARDFEELTPAPNVEIAPSPSVEIAPSPSVDGAPAVVHADAFMAEAKSDLTVATEAVTEFAGPATEVISAPIVPWTPARAAFDAVTFEPTRGLQEIFPAAAIPAAPTPTVDPRAPVDVPPIPAAVNSSMADATSNLPETAELAEWFTGLVAGVVPPVHVMPISGAADMTTAEVKSELAETTEAAAALGLSVENSPAVAPAGVSAAGAPTDSQEVAKVAGEGTVAAEPESKPEPALVVPTPLLKPVVERPILSYRG